MGQGFASMYDMMLLCWTADGAWPVWCILWLFFFFTVWLAGGK